MLRKLAPKAKAVFLAFPDVPEAKDKIGRIDRLLQSQFPDTFLFSSIAPVNSGHPMTRKVAMAARIINLSRCEEFWQCAPKSYAKHLEAELAFAEAAGMTIVDRSYLWYLFDTALSFPQDRTESPGEDALQLETREAI